MYHFFVDPSAIGEGKVKITGADLNHMKNVLRMKTGEAVLISDGTGKDYNCQIESYAEGEGILEILSENEDSKELPSRIWLFQGLPKADKMELIIQKAVELGAYEIIPVETKRCVVKLDGKKAAKKVERWQQIAESAAKQSKRTVIPQIQMPLSWKQALEEAKELDVVLVPYENERGMEATREIFRSIPEGASIGVMIGPEGGFSPEEIAQLDKDMHRISLGRRILRTETAGMATLSMLIYELDI